MTSMNRSTVGRLLQREVSVEKSRTLKRRVFDDWTRGWKLHWTSSPYAHPYVEWVNGSTIGARSTQDDERERLRDECLTEVENVLTRHGYATKREPGCVLILRKVREQS